VTGIKDLNDILNGATEYTNWFGEKAYGGPQPPLWHEPHTYTIVVYALNGSVNLEDDEEGIIKTDFEAALSRKIITSGKISGIFPKQFEGTWEPTGQIDLKELNSAFYLGDSIAEYPAVEYRLKVGDDEYIDLDENNAKEIYISYKIDEEMLSILGEGLGEGPEGYVPLIYLEPGEDKNLWLPIIPEVFEYLITVVTKDDKVYRTTLDWKITQAEVSFYEPEEARDVFEYDAVFDIVEIDFSKVELGQLLDLPTEEGSCYAIELNIQGINPDASNVVSSLRINFRDGEFKKEEVGNLRYVTTKWLPGPNILFYTLDKDDSIYFVEFEVLPLTPEIIDAKVFDINRDGVIDSFLIQTDRSILDTSVDFQKFKINGQPAIAFNTGFGDDSENDEWFWIDFAGDYSTGDLPELIVEADAFQDHQGRANLRLTSINVVDWAEPILVSAEVDGDVLTLTFSEDLDENAIPDGSDFEIKINGNSVNVINVEIDEEQVILTLAQEVASDNTVTISYTPSANSELQDVFGNKVDALVEEVVTVLTPDTFMEEMFIQSIELLSPEEGNESDEDVSDSPILNEDEQEEESEELDGENVVEDDEEEEEQEQSEEENDNKE
jgi:uncharacterized repeat protein (TIGR02059 family)